MDTYGTVVVQAETLSTTVGISTISQIVKQVYSARRSGTRGPHVLDARAGFGFHCFRAPTELKRCPKAHFSHATTELGMDQVLHIVMST